MHHGIYEIPPFGHYYDGLWERHNKGQGLKKMCSKCPIYSYWLSPISLCLYRIRSFIVVGHKLFYVSFKNATIDFIIIIVNTLASDELTLATFMFEPETFRPDLLFIMLFSCKISAKQYEPAQYQCTYNTGYLVYKRPL